MYTVRSDAYLIWHLFRRIMSLVHQSGELQLTNLLNMPNWMRQVWRSQDVDMDWLSVLLTCAREELYGYAHYIQQYKMQPANVTFIWVDVICKYCKWARNAGLLEECLIKPALSVMHAKAHNWTCQVQFDWLERANTKFHLSVENSS